MVCTGTCAAGMAAGMRGLPVEAAGSGAWRQLNAMGSCAGATRARGPRPPACGCCVPCASNGLAMGCGRSATCGMLLNRCCIRALGGNGGVLGSYGCDGDWLPWALLGCLLLLVTF